MKYKISRGDLWAVIFLLLFTLAYFGHFILEGEGRILSSPRGDLAHSGLYYSELGFSLIKNGKAPLWNPYVFSGVPLLAGIQAAFYYPLRWLSFFMEEGRAINISFILHFFLGSFFLYILLRSYSLSPFSSVIAGIIFFFSAIPLFHLYAGHDSDIWTMIWLPPVIFFLGITLQKRGIIAPIGGGIALGMQILACHPQHVYYTLFAGCFYFLFHLPLKRPKNYYFSLSGKVALFLITALGLSAIQLVPAMEMTRSSIRAAGASISWIGQNSLPPENFLTMISPAFFGDMITSPYLGRWYLWENCLYMGAGAIVLGALAVLFERERRVYFAFGLTILGLVLATGKYNPVFPYLVRFFPGFSLFRGHAKFIYLYGFGLSILAGYGVEYLVRLKDAVKKKGLKKFLLFWIITALIIATLTLAFFPPRGAPSPLWKKIIGLSFIEGERYGVTPSDFIPRDFAGAYDAMLRSVRMSLVFLVVTIFGIYTAIRKMKAARLILVLAVCGDLFIFGQKYIVSFSRKDFIEEEPAFGFVRKDKSFFRTGELAPEFLNRNILHRVCSVGGYAGNILFRYNLFINAAENLPLDGMRLAMFLNSHSRLLDALNLKYILSPSFKRVSHPSFKLVYEDGMMSVYENTKALPRVYLVPEVIRVASEEEALKTMLSPEFDFLERAVVEGGREPAGLEEGPFDNSGEASIIRYEPDEVEVYVRSEKDAFLVLADMYYPGWNVYIDLNPGEVFPTDYIFRGVKVPAGAHSVVFRYEPGSYSAGVFITIFTLIALPFGLLYGKRAGYPFFGWVGRF